MKNNISMSNETIASSVDINSTNIMIKKNPKNPMRYFWIVSFVAFIIKDIVSAIPSSVYSLLIMFTTYYSSLTGEEFKLSDYGSFIEIFNSAFSSFTIILFGILFVKYITSKTIFNGNIKKYKYIYYTWSFAVGGFVLDIVGLISSLVLLKIETDYASVSRSIITLALSSVISVISFGVSAFAAYLCARLLNAAAFSDENNQLKVLRLLAIGTTTSVVISLIVYVIRIVVLSDFSISTTISTFLSKFITIAAIWIVATVKPKDKNGEKLIFAIIPIVAICDSVLFSIIDSFNI